MSLLVNFRIIPRERRDQVYLAVDIVLSDAGVENSNYRSKRKGDIEYLDSFDKPKLVPKLVPKQEL